MDTTFHSTTGGADDDEGERLNDNNVDKCGKPSIQEEYDPSQPLDSSDEEEQSHGTLNFEKEADDDEVATTVIPIPDVPLPPDPPLTGNWAPPLEKVEQPPLRKQSQTQKSSTEPSVNVPTVISKEADIDLSSIPMPTDEYRRPTIQFSIPTRHRLMSISSLIKRQKGISKKQDKLGTLSFNSEVTKAFQKGQESGADVQESDEDKPKTSLLHEIFGSDEEDASHEETNNVATTTTPVTSGDESKLPSTCSSPQPSLSARVPPEAVGDDSKWKSMEELELLNAGKDNVAKSDSPNETIATSSPIADEEITISIKPSSELLEPPGNDSNSPPDLITVDPPDIGHEGEANEDQDNNKLVILECVSDDDDDFEVTFVGIGKANLADLRQGRLTRRRRKDSEPQKELSKFKSPVNGFEEGEIVDSDKKKKKEKKRKKMKKRRRSRSRDSKANSDNSNIDSPDKKSVSSSDEKEVSWRRPKSTKSRNYRNGKRPSEERPGDRFISRRDEPPRRRSRSPFLAKVKPHRNRSNSLTRYRSRGRSDSKSPPPRRAVRLPRGSKRFKRGGSSRSRSSGSNKSSSPHSRSRSLTKRKLKRRHSPSPRRKLRKKPISLSPPRKSPSPRVRKSSKTDIAKYEKIRNKSPSPMQSSSKRSLKVDIPQTDPKKKLKKDKASPEDTEKEREKKRKKKKREKSLSPVKAIVADGDSIVVSLNFQKSKEDTSKSKMAQSQSERQGKGEEVNANKTSSTCEEIDAPLTNFKPSPRKGTILINLDASPRVEKTIQKSPAADKFDEESERDSSKKDERKGQDQKNDAKADIRVDGADIVSSSHDSLNDNAQDMFASSPEKDSSSPDRLINASRGSYKQSDFFVSSTCDSKSSAAAELLSPKATLVSTGPLHKSSDGIEASKQTIVNSPFDTVKSNVLSDSVSEKGKVASPDVSQFCNNKPSNTHSTKPMIGNIPGLFPSGLSSVGGLSTPSVIIPAPPKMIPNAAPSSLLNNLVSVASALYAPLLAAKQPSSAIPSRHMQTSGSNSTLLPKHGSDSPFSPNSSDGDDLFEPPNGDGNHVSDSLAASRKGSMGDSARRQPSNSNALQMPKYTNTHTADKRALFDTLFHGSQKAGTPPKSHPLQKKGVKDNRKGGKYRKGYPLPKRQEDDRNGELDINARLLAAEDVPNSAVALNINEKYLKKLNRQERVVEEVKLSLKPHYIKKHISKDDYKDILRKTVPKICHNKTGEINPNKIKELVEAYVKKYRKSRKGGTMKGI